MATIEQKPQSLEEGQEGQRKETGWEGVAEFNPTPEDRIIGDAMSAVKKAIEEGKEFVDGYYVELTPNAIGAYTGGTKEGAYMDGAKSDIAKPNDGQNYPRGSRTGASPEAVIKFIEQRKAELAMKQNDAAEAKKKKEELLEKISDLGE